MRKILHGLAALAIVAGGAVGVATAQDEKSAEPTHFPIEQPKEMSWSFSGPFGTYDKAQLQRGLKVYKEVCAACHSLDLVAFRNLADLGYSEGQIKTLAADYQIHDGPNDDGEMFDRPGKTSDYFPSPYPNVQAGAAANGGSAPPDLSLMAKAREVKRGFPRFVFDIFTQYEEGGPDYIHAFVSGFGQQPPAGVTVPEGSYYNPHFIAGASTHMPPPLQDGQITYDDDAPQTVDQYSRDVAAFLMWAAEPHMEARKQMGFRVMIFILLFGVLAYLTKRKVWTGIAH